MIVNLLRNKRTLEITKTHHIEKQPNKKLNMKNELFGVNFHEKKRYDLFQDQVIVLPL